MESLQKIAWWDWSPEVIASRVDSFYLPIEEFVAMYLPKVGSPSTSSPPALQQSVAAMPSIKVEYKLDAPAWKPKW